MEGDNNEWCSGDIPGGPCHHDPDAHIEEGLRKVQQGLSLLDLHIFFVIRYSKEDEIDDMERDLGDEYGWKQVKTPF